MKKFLTILLTALLIVLPAALAEDALQQSEPIEEMPWYELSGEDKILTVRLDDERDDGMNWQFEISAPEALELLTQEVIGDEPEETISPMTYAASFMSMANTQSNVSLILKYNAPDSLEAPAATRVLEMKVSEENVISVASVLDRDQNADWLEYDAANSILTVRLPEQSGDGYAWNMSILDPEILELITCDTEEGYVGSFASMMKKAGTTELTLSYGKEDSETPEIMYTVNLSADENGKLDIHWAETFSITRPAAPADAAE